jgi:hypothetical protein
MQKRVRVAEISCTLHAILAFVVELSYLAAPALTMCAPPWPAGSMDENFRCNFVPGVVET